MMVPRAVFDIAGRQVGGSAPCFVIAEAGLSHFGDWDLACQLVDMAAEAGADAFKTQFFDVDHLISSRATDWKDRLRPRNLSFEQAQRLKARCDEKGILFMSTAHDPSRIGWLRELDVPAVKVGSGERNNPAFIKALAALNKPMIISTGMYGIADLEEAVAAAASGGCDRVALLHCVTSYPAPDREVNLRAMEHIRSIFRGPVGYSDHTEDHLAVLAAVACGAKVIEKHITILRNVPNAQDWKVSAGPEDFGQLVHAIRRIEMMLGHGRKEATESERPGTQWALKSLVATRDLPKGHRVEDHDVVAKRPGDGLPPNQLHRVIGKRLARAMMADEPFTDAILDP